MLASLSGNVSDSLKSIEPSLSKRKGLAIEILRDLEREEGHDVRAIERALQREGREGILKRARKKRRKKREEEAEEGALEVAEEKAI